MTSRSTAESGVNEARPTFFGIFHQIENVRGPV
jgi:hypothetical protein